MIAHAEGNIAACLPSSSSEESPHALLFALSVAAQAQSGTAPTNSRSPECPDYAAKLDSCSPYTCTFTHPITGDILERKIVGLAAGNCATVESMPGTHKMTCQLPPETRKAVATFFRAAQSAAAAGQSVGGTLKKGDRHLEATTTIDGTPVANPLQRAFEAGVCQIGE